MFKKKKKKTKKQKKQKEKSSSDLYHILEVFNKCCLTRNDKMYLLTKKSAFSSLIKKKHFHGCLGSMKPSNCDQSEKRKRISLGTNHNSLRVDLSSAAYMFSFNITNK